ASRPAPARPAAPPSRRRPRPDDRGARAEPPAGVRRRARRRPHADPGALPGIGTEQGRPRPAGSPVTPRLLRAAAPHRTRPGRRPRRRGVLRVAPRRPAGAQLRPVGTFLTVATWRAPVARGGRPRPAPSRIRFSP